MFARARGGSHLTLISRFTRFFRDPVSRANARKFYDYNITAIIVKSCTYGFCNDMKDERASKRGKREREKERKNERERTKIL